MEYSPPENLTLIADGHLHVYPAYSLEKLAQSCLRAITRIGGGGAFQPAALLTESAGHNFFRSARQGKERVDGGCTIEPGPDDDTLWLEHPDHEQRLLLFAGRQIATRERLEVLALGRDIEVADGLPATETLNRVRDGGACPCLAWAAGKWWGARGRIVKSLLSCRTGNLTVGDSALRPQLWREPALMRTAAKRGLPVLAGSDPLPFPGDERRAGQYVFCITLEGCDPRSPSAALRAAFTNGNAAVRRLGSRCNPLSWLRGRILHHRLKLGKCAKS